LLLVVSIAILVCSVGGIARLAQFDLNGRFRVTEIEFYILERAGKPTSRWGPIRPDILDALATSEHDKLTGMGTIKVVQQPASKLWMWSSPQSQYAALCGWSPVGVLTQDDVRSVNMLLARQVLDRAIPIPGLSPSLRADLGRIIYTSPDVLVHSFQRVGRDTIVTNWICRVAITMIAGGCAIGLLTYTCRLLRRRRRSMKGCCVKCGYPIPRDHPRCPECGALTMPC
jgi:hypothetical protein